MLKWEKKKQGEWGTGEGISSRSISTSDELHRQVIILFFFRLQGEAAAAEELDYETFLAQVKDQSELSFFEHQPIGVNPPERFKDQSKLRFKKNFIQYRPVHPSTE